MGLQRRRLKLALGVGMTATALALGACGGSDDDERKGSLESRAADTSTTPDQGADAIYQGGSAPSGTGAPTAAKEKCKNKTGAAKVKCKRKLAQQP